MKKPVLALLFLLPVIAYSQVRRAQSLIEKDRRQDAYELLLRAVEKDSLASPEQFVLAGLFVDRQFQFYNIDSAYFYIINARRSFSQLEEKTQERLAGNGFNLEVYDTLKKNIETAGFVRAKGLGREQDYISFMTLFPEAEQIDSAIILRNAEAFRKARKEDSFTGYQTFFLKYPKAQEVKEARRRYHKLLYEDRTASGKLAAFQDFLVEYPETWHRNEVEEHIFRIMTGRNTISAYREFIASYPESVLVEKAKIYAYQLAPEPQKPGLLNEFKFSKEARDSLVQLSAQRKELLLLSHDGQSLEIINAKGGVVLDSLPGLVSRNKCEDLGRFLLLEGPDFNQLMQITGSLLIKGDYTDYMPISEGFLRLKSPDGDEIIHIDGSPTTGERYTQATLVAGMITYKKEGLWGIKSITGIAMLEPIFDTLFHVADRLVISKNGKWGMAPVEDFYPLLDQEKVALDYPYDSLAIVRNNEVFIQMGDKTGLLDANFKTIVPLGEPLLEILEDGYFLETNDSILDSRLGQVWYSDLQFNDRWTIGERSETSDLYFDGRKIIEADGAELMGRSAVLMNIAGKSYCYFNPDSKITLPDGADIKPLRKMGENSVIRHYLFIDQKGRQAVIDEDGKRVKIPRFDRLIDLGEDYMIFSVKGLVYNILDNKGKVILKNVDAATALDSGYISYLTRGRFGLFNNRNATLIEAKYDKPLRRYDEELFIIEDGGKLGLINRLDSVYIEPKYEEILPLNDSIAVLKADFRWTFWNLNAGRIMLDNVSDYWEISTDLGTYFKIFKGIGYGVWQPQTGLILNSTYDELTIKTNSHDLVFITEKWVEEADLVILLYYDPNGELVRKSVLTTAQFETLQCKPNY